MFNTETQKGIWAAYLENGSDIHIGELSAKTAEDVEITNRSPRAGGQNSGVILYILIQVHLVVLEMMLKL